MPVRRRDDLSVTLPALRALSEETRFRIAAMLGSGAMTVSEIAEELDASQPLISFHLGRLRAAGVVVALRQGKWVSYSLNRRLVAVLERMIGNLASDLMH